MAYQFELVQKMNSREVITRSDDIWALLCEAATALAPRPGSVGKPTLSGARGEIEIGIQGGSQVLLRVIS